MIILFLLQIKKLRHRIIKYFAQGQQLGNDRDRRQTQAVLLQTQHSLNHYTASCFVILRFEIKN